METKERVKIIQLEFALNEFKTYLLKMVDVINKATVSANELRKKYEELRKEGLV